MARKIETVDDIDPEDGRNNDGWDIDPEHYDPADPRCRACPDRWKCKVREALGTLAARAGDAFLRARFFLEDGFACIAFPLVNLWNKHRGGIKCPWCGAYIRHDERFDFCTHCGKPWISQPDADPMGDETSRRFGWPVEIKESRK